MSKRHHYVPIFYQKGFSANDKLWKYDRKWKSYKHSSPKENLWEEDLYSVYPPNTPVDRRIETDVLSRIDGAAAPIIKQLEPGMKLNESDTNLLLQFLGLQFTRMPSFARMVRRTLEAHMDEYLLDRFGTVGRAEQALAELESTTGEARTITAEAMVESVTQRRIHANANETVFLKQMFEHANYIANLLRRSSWTILVAPKTSGFIICDHPIVSVPPASHVGPVAIGTPGALAYIPLKRRFCLRVQLGDYGFTYKHVDSREVRTINYNIAANSGRYVLAADRAQLEAVIDKSGTATMDQRDDFTIEVFRPDANNTFMKFDKKTGKFFY